MKTASRLGIEAAISLLVLRIALLVLMAGAPAMARADPLSSWNDGSAKAAITDFVARVTAAGGPDFVPPDQRIAVFDNDGTLWAEQPAYFQLLFALDRVIGCGGQRVGSVRDP